MDSELMSIDKLVQTFANELAAKSNKSAKEVEDILWPHLHHDIINGLLDKCGPLTTGTRLGVQVLDAIGQARDVEGRMLFREIAYAISLTKEAWLHFTHRQKLPLPSCWPCTTKGTSQPSRFPEDLQAAPEAIGTASSERPREVTQPQLAPAPRAVIIEMIETVYNTADAEGKKPPNEKELPVAVFPLLEQQGWKASARYIQELGRGERFKGRRRPPGKTLASERRKRNDSAPGNQKDSVPESELPQR